MQELGRREANVEQSCRQCHKGYKELNTNGIRREEAEPGSQ